MGTQTTERGPYNMELHGGGGYRVFGPGPISSVYAMRPEALRAQSLANAAYAVALSASSARVAELEKALHDIATDPPVSETPTIESILNRAQKIARAALARKGK